MNTVPMVNNRGMAYGTLPDVRWVKSESGNKLQQCYVIPTGEAFSYEWRDVPIVEENLCGLKNDLKK